MSQGTQNDAGGPTGRPPSPAVQMPAPDHIPDPPASMPPAPVGLHFVPQPFPNREYADLEFISNGVRCSAHKIIVCSQSPVLKQMCDRERSPRIELNQYDPNTLKRVLNFCYRRTYRDGEYPETVAPFLLRMTVDDVRDALETPLALASDVGGLGQKVICTQCNGSDGEGGEGEAQGRIEDGAQEKVQEEAQEEGEDEYLPDRCEIDYFSEDSSESSDDEISPPGTPLGPNIPEESPQPPYRISLFANLRVYIAAKELQIPALQLLARERFAHTVRAHWSRFKDFPALIERVYVRTEKGDHLRTLICQIVAAGYGEGRETDFKAKVREVMVGNGEFATDVLDMVLRMRSEW